jgi:uncharacterized membrane protein
VTRLQRFRELFAPWAGIALGTLAAGVMHQAGSDSVFNDCAVATPLPVLIIGIVAIVVVVLAGLMSLRVARNEREGRSRRMIGGVSVGMSGLFLLAIIIPMIASLVLPPCFG